MTGNLPLRESRINIRIRLSFLWTAVMFCFIYGDYFELYVPGKTKGLVNGANMLNSPSKLLIASVVLAVPAVLIVLTLTLKAVVSRWMNVGFGILYMVMMLLIAMTSLSVWLSFYVFFACVEVVLTGLIVWYSFHWPRGDDDPTIIKQTQPHALTRR